MASTDARPFPIKNTAYRVTFPILDADGDLVTGATGLDSEVSKDAGTFADCTNEATEIATSSGMYYLDLTSTEMNADCVAVIVKTSSSGAKTTPIVLYPVEAGDIDVDVTSWNGTAVATPATAGYPAVTIKSGTGTGEINLTSGRADANMTYIAGAAVSTSTAQLGVNAVQAGGTAWGSGAITAASIAADAIGASELAADAVAEIADAVWDELLSGHALSGSAGQAMNRVVDLPDTDGVSIAVWDANRASYVTAGTFGQGVASVQGNVTGSVGSVTGNVGGNVTGSVASIAAGGITASSIATGAVDADALAADAVDEILDEVIEGSMTLRQALRILIAAAAGKASGGGTTSIAFRDQADTKDRIAATVDSSGNRTAVTLDAS